MQLLANIFLLGLGITYYKKLDTGKKMRKLEFCLQNGRKVWKILDVINLSKSTYTPNY